MKTGLTEGNETSAAEAMEGKGNEEETFLIKNQKNVIKKMKTGAQDYEI